MKFTLMLDFFPRKTGKKIPKPHKLRLLCAFMSLGLIDSTVPTQGAKKEVNFQKIAEDFEKWLCIESTPKQAPTNLGWLNNVNCEDIVCYAVIEMIIYKVKCKKSVDELTFANTLAELCMIMLRQVLFNKQYAPETEADLNNAISKELTLPSNEWSDWIFSSSQAYEERKNKVNAEIVKQKARAFKLSKIIDIFFEKLSTASQQNCFMGYNGSFSKGDTEKRLITLVIWHLKAKYGDILLPKVQEYCKSNVHWGDYISGILHNAGIDMSGETSGKSSSGSSLSDFTIPSFG